MANLRTLADTRMVQPTTTTRAPATSRVTIGIPSRGQMASHCARTLVDMAIWDQVYGRGWLRHDKPTIWIIGATLITNSRNTLVEQFLALDDKPEWLLFVDDDQVYPSHLIEVLMAAVDAVQAETGQMCLTMGVPVWRFEGQATEDVRVTHNVFDIRDDGQFAPRTEPLPSNAVVQVGAIGAGCLLVHREAFERTRQISSEQGLGDKSCWFRHVAWPINEGEDVYFCRLLGASGIPLWVTTSVGNLEHIKQIRLAGEIPVGSVKI